MDILNWEDIAADFNECLLLGNGGSIAVDDKFFYGSLYAHASGKGLITENVGKLFEYFGNDFEYVLRMLMYATEINQALEIEDKTTESAYAETRLALINTVQDIHPDYKEVLTKLPKIAKFIGVFDTVMSLSYDLLIYWARLSKHGTGVTFKDCFISGEFDSEWERFREPIYGEKKVTLVFYPHGNLVLSTGVDRMEKKISIEDDGSNLLEKIIETWESRKHVPLFVSEGTKERKTQSILGSQYLRTVYEEVLPDIEESLVIYGCALADSDDHILEKIAESAVKRIAVSVWKGEDNFLEKCTLTEMKIKRILGKGVDVVFFDSKSKNCWVNSDYMPIVA